MAAVSFDEVTKQFGSSTVAVDRLTLDVNEGEFLVLVGPSGCGKTTALRMVAGLEEVDERRDRIGDRVVNDVAPTRARHRDGLPELRAVSAHDACSTTSRSRCGSRR